MQHSYTSLPNATPFLGLSEVEPSTKRSRRRKSLSILVGLLLLLAVGVGAFFVDAEELLRALTRGETLDSLGLMDEKMGISEVGVIERPVIVPTAALSCPETLEAARVLRESREVDNWIAEREFFSSTALLFSAES